MNKNIQKLKNIRGGNNTASNLIKNEKEILLLSNNDPVAQNNMKILQRLNLTGDLEQKQRIVNKQKEYEHLSDKFKRNVFKVSEVYDLCKTYNLRLVTTTKYTGSMRLEVGAAIQQFYDEFKYTHKRNNYSEAVEKSEILLESSRFVVLTTPSNKSKSVSIFYIHKEDGIYNLADDDYLIEVVSFGEPYSEFRRIGGITDGFTNVSTVVMLIVFMLSIILSFVVHQSFIWFSLISAIFMSLSVFLCKKKYISKKLLDRTY